MTSASRPGVPLATRHPRHAVAGDVGDRHDSGPTRSRVLPPCTDRVAAPHADVIAARPCAEDALDTGSRHPALYPVELRSGDLTRRGDSLAVAGRPAASREESSDKNQTRDPRVHGGHGSPRLPLHGLEQPGGGQ